jgi:hypothetical protein
MTLRCNELVSLGSEGEWCGETFQCMHWYLLHGPIKLGTWVVSAGVRDIGHRLCCAVLTVPLFW